MSDRIYRRVVALLAIIWLAAMGGASFWGDDPTRNTVRIALAYYAVAMWFILRLRIEEWQNGAPIVRLARWCWTLAWAAFVIHVGAAFHFHHHWSHLEAVQHVRDRSGVGEGIFASYAFTVAWMIDVAWWWLRPESFGRRPIWISRVLYGFMLAMVFTATVVYEEGPIRWAGAVICLVLTIGWRSGQVRPQADDGAARREAQPARATARP